MLVVFFLVQREDLRDRFIHLIGKGVDRVRAGRRQARPSTFLPGILLGSDPVFEPSERIYQRLVAGDYDEAAELFEDYLERQSLVEVYDTLLIPALALAETHWQLGELYEAKHGFIMESLKEMIQDQGERRHALLAKQEIADAQAAEGDADAVEEISTSPLSVVCLPARNEADEIAALMVELQQADEIVSLAKPHGGHGFTYFGTWVNEQLPI